MRARDRRSEQAHEARPVEVRAGVPVHARLVDGGGAGHVVVADDVLAVERDAVALRLVPGQLRERRVEPRREPLRELGRVALVLDPDRVGVHPPVARVPRDVLRRDHLRHVAVLRAEDVVRAHVGVRVLELGDRVVVADLGVVDHDVADREAVGRPVREVVVAVVAGIGRVLRVCRRREVAAEAARALGARRRLRGRLRVPRLCARVVVRRLPRRRGERGAGEHECGRRGREQHGAEPCAVGLGQGSPLVRRRPSYRL